MTPITRYHQALTVHGFVHDPAQEHGAQHLQRLYDDLLATNTLPPESFGWRSLPGLARILGWCGTSRWQSCRGLYLWGGVGRGKTWLVDSLPRRNSAAQLDWLGLMP